MAVPDGQTAADALKHVDQGHITGLIAWVLGGMASLIALLLGWDRKATKKSVATLFRWKDDVVDKALKEFPEKYVAKGDCTRQHEDAAKRHDEILYEIRETRKLILRHLNLNGGGDGP